METSWGVLHWLLEIEMTRDDILSGDTYERWTDGEFSIARYSWWIDNTGQQRGTFFCVYDLDNASRRINQKPFDTFTEAVNALAEYRRTKDERASIRSST